MASADAPAVQAAAIAEGGIPVLEAFCRAHPSGMAGDDAHRTLGMLRGTQQEAQEAQQPDQQAVNGAAGRSGDNSGAVPCNAAPGGSSSAAAAAASGSTRRRRNPHRCGWCGLEAQDGTRFKKCATCQQVREEVPFACYLWTARHHAKHS